MVSSDPIGEEESLSGVFRKSGTQGRFVPLPRWYRTTRDSVSHLFGRLGARSVEARCGHFALAASLVVEAQFQQERCLECRKAKGGRK